MLTSAQAKAWEAALLKDDTAEWDAMQRAGASLAVAVAEDYREIGGLPQNARILILAGKGHNGGDALLAAAELLRRFRQATADVVCAFGETALRPLPRRALTELRDADHRVRVRMMPASMSREIHDATYDLCLDGIFGFQFRAPMDAATAELIEAVNAHRGIRFRAAVDLPSGVGEVNASTVFRADFTYATGIVKQPVLSPATAASVGRLRYLDLGFFSAGEPSGSRERILTAEVLAPLTTLRSSQTDKRSFGHLLVVGGSRSYPGAVVLAVRAALRSGVGLVTAFVPERLAPEYAARYPEAMWVGCPETAKGGLAAGTVELIQERLSRATALLMGPGMSAEPEVLRTMEAIVRNTNIPLVLDADALRPEVMAATSDKSVICTPHAGEYQRLGGRAGLQPASGSTDVVAVLKGPLTRVVGETGRSESGHTYYSPFGGPVLARGGSGDILAGLIGGLLAQKPDELLLAACRGVVWHGRAADLLARTRGQVAVELSEILEQLGPALHS
ncbi:MAG TPA: NAD(P)H-hydrate dehydratase [Lacunisphaera sp.]